MQRQDLSCYIMYYLSIIHWTSRATCLRQALGDFGDFQLRLGFSRGLGFSLGIRFSFEVGFSFGFHLGWDSHLG